MQASKASPRLQDVDGVLMVMDPSQPEQERDLEQFYMNFAQPNSLTMKQCLVMAIQVTREGSFGLGGWSGEQISSFYHLRFLRSRLSHDPDFLNRYAREAEQAHLDLCFLKPSHGKFWSSGNYFSHATITSAVSKVHAQCPPI